MNKLEYKIQCVCGNTRNVRKNLFKSSILQNGQSIKDCCRQCFYKKEKEMKSDFDLFKHYLKVIKSKASNRKNGIFFNIPENLLYTIIKQNCIYCNQKPNNQFKIIHNSGNLYFTYQGIDRIDSSKEYTLDNVVPCCKRCNKAKGEDSLQSFLE